MLPMLILAHLLADFVLQTRRLAERKCALSGLAVHTGLVALAAVLVAWQRLGRWWPWLIVVVGTHGAIDWTKIALQRRLRWPPIVLFLADQALHGLVIGAVVIAAGQGSDTSWVPGKLWWTACAYVVATWAVSIALPLWLDPAGFTRRPAAARLVTIVAAATALTLAWRGAAILVPVVGLGLYQGVGRRVANTPVTGTFGIEFWAAIVVAASLGWALA